MDNWATTTIGRLGQVFDGPHATPKTISEGPIFLGIGALQDGRINLGETRHVTPHDFEKWTRRVRPQTGDIVFSYETRLGQAAIIPEGMECCLGRRMGLVRVEQNKILPRFFLYKYISPDFQEFLRSRTVHGATVDRILLTEFPDFPFPCPPLDEQQAIVSVLGALDDKIELNRRTNETLEAIARAIFKDWFVDFGPTRAKAGGRVPYLSPELWDQFPVAVDDQGNPEGWTKGTLADVADSPRRSVRPVDVAENTPYIGLEHMPRHSIALTAWEGAGKVTSNKSVFKKGEFLFGKLRPYFHKVGVAPLNGICSTDIVVVVPRAPALATLTLAYLSSDEFVDYTNQTSTGTKMPRTSWKTMSRYKICLPSEQVARNFQSRTQPLMDRISTNIHELLTLARTHDFLLPKLLSGEIRLREAEKAVETMA